ncbi:MAG: hypothetical protein M1824_000660 [Vezdaea acicularis]|nr:MAG: hypothetical protein M1824_000660 [Vezdaea acicularis]
MAALLRSTRCAIKVPAPAYSMISRSARSSFLNRSAQLAPTVSCPAIRRYSAPAGLAKPEVEGRIMDLLKNFDKVNDASKISSTSHFSNDLGLDSLDTVEVVMAIEEEFSIEIPDKEADAIQSIINDIAVEKAVDYILEQPDAH